MVFDAKKMPRHVDCSIVKRERAVHERNGSLLEEEVNVNGSYCCDVCGMGFTNESLLVSHIQLHIECPFCDKRFRNDTGMKVHLSSAHMGLPWPMTPGKLPCTICGVIFQQLEALKAHVNVEHQIKKAKRTYAKKSVSAISPRVAPLINGGSAEPSMDLDCSVCGQKFSSTTSVVEHILNNHVNRGTQSDTLMKNCLYCDMRFRERKILHLHVRNCHKGLPTEVKDGPISSKICNVILKRIEQPKAAPSSSLCCNVCGQKFNDQDSALNHMLYTHSNYRDIGETMPISDEEEELASDFVMQPSTEETLCSYCNVVSVSRDSHEIHMRVAHRGLPISLVDGPISSKLCFVVLDKMPEEEEEEEVDSCEFCGQIFTDKTTLVDHIMDEHVAKSDMMDTIYGELYECEKCGEIFSQAVKLKSHTLLKHIWMTECVYVGDGPFSCFKCEKVFNARQSLENHLLQHEGLMNYECPICSKKFFKRANLKQHIVIHTKKKPFKCDVCKQKFRSLANLKTHTFMHENKTENCRYCPIICKNFVRLQFHVRKYHRGLPPVVESADDPVDCRICRMNFDDLESLMKHASEQHSARKRWICKFCGEAFAHIVEKRQHVKLNHFTQSRRSGKTIKEKISYDCNECGRVLTSRRTFLLHMTTHTNAGTECLMCDRKFKHKSKYRLHLRGCRRRQQRDERNYSLRCPHCRCKCKNTERLEYHVKRFHPGLPAEIKDGPVGCTICGTSFETLEVLKEHVQVDHPVEKTYECMICGETFANEGEMKGHLQESHPSEIFRCDQCDEIFTNKGTFARHMDYHNPLSYTRRTLEAPLNYECEKCGLKFMSKEHVEVHIIRKHVNSKIDDYKGDGPFKCKDCGKILARKYSLERHLLRHDGSTGLECSKCPRTFLSVSDLKTHMTRHSNKRPYGCRICKKAFKSKVILKRHIIQQHTGTVEECPYCGLKCKNNICVTTHIRMYHKGLPFENRDTGPIRCRACKVMFDGLDALKEHCATEHPNASPFRCSVCKERFNSLGELEDHQLTCTSKKHHKRIKHRIYKRPPRPHKKSPKVRRTIDPALFKFECEKCGKRFQDEIRVKVHILREHSDNKLQSYTGKGPFECKECGKKLARMHTLELHLLRHEGIVGIECPKCSKSFLTKCNLMQHIRTHDTTALKCKFCNWTCKDPEKLRQHETNHPTRTKECPYCGAIRSRVKHLNRHIRSYHKGLPCVIQNDGPIPCSACPEIFDNLDLLMEHCNVEHPCPKPFKCRNCKERFEKKDIFDDHLKGFCEEAGTAQVVTYNGDTVVIEKKYVCEICEMKCGTRNSLERHMGLKHHVGGRFGCVLCLKKFFYNSEFKAHLKTCRRRKQRVNTKKCLYCPVEVTDDERLKMHVSRLHPGLPIVIQDDLIQCTVCDQICETLEALKEHATVQHPVEKAFECLTCGDTFVTEVEMEEHIKESHLNIRCDLPCICGKCGKVLSNKYTLERHLAMHKKIKTCMTCSKEFLYLIEYKRHLKKCQKLYRTQNYINCSYCLIKCSNRERLERHVDRFHIGLPVEITDGAIECTICRRSFETLEGLKEHISTQHVVSNHECKFCDDSFGTEDSLMDHIRLIHNVGDLQFKCGTCGETFNRKVQLKIHMKTHVGERVPQETERSYDCEICGKIMANRASLYRHLKIHKSKRGPKCPKCSKRLAGSTELRRHMTFVHTDRRPFACKICKKTFKAQSNLRRHLILHSTTPEECSYCDMKCSNTDRLKCHVRKYHRGLPVRHSGDGPVNCMVCRRSFDTLEALKEHAGIEHPSMKLTERARINAFRWLQVSKKRNYLPCPHCSGIFKNREFLEEHVKEAHRGLPVDVEDMSISPQVSRVVMSGVAEVETIADTGVTDDIQHHSDDYPAEGLTFAERARSIKEEVVSDDDDNADEFLTTDLEVDNYVLQPREDSGSVLTIKQKREFS